MRSPFPPARSRAVAALVAVTTAFAVLTLVPDAAVAESGAKITQSRSADGGHPYAVAVLDAAVADPFKGQFCGGTHLAVRWVITAAHCTDGRAPADIDVLLGTDRLSSGGERIAVTEIVRAPGYDSRTLMADVALLRMAVPSSAPVVRILVPGLETLAAGGVRATVVGWGGLSGDQDSQRYPDELREGDLPVLDHPTCDERLTWDGSEVYDRVTMVCAGEGTAEQEAVDACQGDSGGPLIGPDPRGGVRQLGLVTWGPTCGNSPSAYTTPSSHLDFLESTTGVSFATFPDIRGNTHRASIERVALEGITAGALGGGYRPVDPVSRGQMASFLARALGLDPVEGSRFSDTAGNPHEGHINALADAGVAGGFPDGTFRPDQDVSRAQVASFLARALELAPVEGSRFSDTEGNVHEGRINALADAGVAGGYPDGTYRPLAPVDRGQMASFLVRAFLRS